MNNIRIYLYSFLLLFVLSFDKTFGEFNQNDCIKPINGCFSMINIDECQNWNGCIWGTSDYDSNDYTCKSKIECNYQNDIENESRIEEVNNKEASEKKTKLPTPWPTLTEIPTERPTNYPFVPPTGTPTKSPIVGMCEIPKTETCPELTSAQNCVSYSGCFWNPVLRKWGNKPECSRTSFPTRRPAENLECVIPVGLTCPEIDRETLCLSFSGCDWIVGKGCVNRPECSKTSFPTPTSGTQEPTRPRTNVPTSSRTDAPTSPTKIISKPSKAPNMRDTKKPSNKPTTFPTFESITSAPTYVPTQSFSEQNCNRFSGSKSTCLLLVYCKWCSGCSKPFRCEHV